MIPDDIHTEILSFRNRNGVAYRDLDLTVTYKQLYNRILRTCSFFDSKGLVKGQVVVTVAHKSPDTIHLMYACWLSGLTFCPIDPSQPLIRQESMLSALPVGIFIYGEGQYKEINNLIDRSTSLGWQVSPVEEGTTYSPLSEFPPNDPSCIAYVLFTSGSTGSPKGVQISQGNLSAFLRNFYPRYSDDSSARYLSIGSYHFDMTLLDCVVPAIHGHETFLYHYPLVGDFFATIIREFRINRFCAVPSVLNLLINYRSNIISKETLSNIDTILLGAERPNIKDLKFLLSIRPQMNIINAYGPTEATICCFAKEFLNAEDLRNGRLPIGRPFHGVRWLIEKDQELIRSKGVGVLYVAGPQVMQGYLSCDSRPQDPFVYVGDTVYYRTGDLVEVGEDGIFYFVGRRDDEVKIKGHRIHLQDVALNAARALRLREVEALCVGPAGSERLILVYCSDSLLDASDHELLRKNLPSSMLPDELVNVKGMPRLNSGKVNRRQLKEVVDALLPIH